MYIIICISRLVHVSHDGRMNVQNSGDEFGPRHPCKRSSRYFRICVRKPLALRVIVLCGLGGVPSSLRFARMNYPRKSHRCHQSGTNTFRNTIALSIGMCKQVFFWNSCSDPSLLAICLSSENVVNFVLANLVRRRS